MSTFGVLGDVVAYASAIQSRPGWSGRNWPVRTSTQPVTDARDSNQPVCLNSFQLVDSNDSN